MKKTVYLFVICALLLALLAGCSLQSKLVGKWLGQDGYYYTFNKDNTFSIDNGQTGTYTLSKDSGGYDRIQMTYDDGQSVDALIMIDSDGMTFISNLDTFVFVSMD
jgi:hypothetical protein